VPDITVGVLGASSLVGRCVLAGLVRDHFKVIAFSRQRQRDADTEAVKWRLIPEDVLSEPMPPIALWICVAPVIALAAHFAWLQACGARKVVALSSTSRFTKGHSCDPQERRLASQLQDAEDRFEVWAQEHGVHWAILRPTLIYGLGQDKNIMRIAGLIRRFGFFPLLGHGVGLRQPVHAEDVALACVRALQSPQVCHHCYDLSGGEVLSYREMVTRIFATLGRRPRLFRVPLWLFRIAVALLQWFPRYRHWSVAMVERMNQDLVFDHAQATRDLGFVPRLFSLSKQDLP